MVQKNADERSRTSKGLPPLVPETSASANSATSARPRHHRTMTPDPEGEHTAARVRVNLLIGVRQWATGQPSLRTSIR